MPTEPVGDEHGGAGVTVRLPLGTTDAAGVEDDRGATRRSEGARLRRAYDRIAADYARANAAVPADFRDRFGPAFVRRCRLAAAGATPSVLDVGCGAGRDLAWLEGSGAAPVGADLSYGMLGEARTRTRGPLLQMDMRSLGFGSGSFHGVWCAASLLHLRKRDAPAALDELRRVLAPRGALFLAVQAGEGERWEAGAYGHPVERLFARYAEAEAEALLAASGFTVEERSASAAGPRQWLRFLAARGGTEHQEPIPET